MIEIAGSDIQELNDSDLRALIGLLCEADLHAIGLSSAGVTWGGDQNAQDGGLTFVLNLPLLYLKTALFLDLKQGSK